MWLFDDTLPLDDYGPYRDGPRRLVIHTPEFPDVLDYHGANSFDAYVEAVRARGRRASYHAVASPIQKKVIQFASFERMVGGLKRPNQYETNGDGAMQISILGYAADMRDLTQDHLNWLADAVFEPIFRQYPEIDFMRWPKGKMWDQDGEGQEEIDWWFDGEDAGFVLADKNSPIRLSYQDWDAYNGVCGHQHVPGNDHWDPGHFDYPYIARRIKKKVEDAGIKIPFPNLQSPITVIDVATAPDGGTWCLLEDGGIANFSGAPYYGHMLDPITVGILGVGFGYDGKPISIVPNALRGYDIWTDTGSRYQFWKGTY